ncbi:MAG: universal stress protein [Gammaproteobacteria bacterium]
MTSAYKTILLALDLTDDSAIVARRGIEIAERFGASLTLLHVVEYVPVEPMGEAVLPAVQVEDELVENARRRLDALAESLGLAKTSRSVEVGNIKAEVVRAAREQRADLIVLGSRERHGLAILVNLTEDAVLHAAPCDVLAVRLH